MRRKPRFFLISLLLIIAGLFRLYTSCLVPFIPDEQELIDFIKNISLARDHWKLPIGDKDLQNPILSTYIIKLGVALFGTGQLEIRLLFVALGTLGLFFIFKLVEENLKTKTAFLTLYFLSFSQYHIGVTRFAYEGTLFFFFMPLALYTFFRGLHTQKAKYVMFTAIFIGFGCLAYEGMVLFASTLLFYLIVNRNHRFWLRRKEFYFSLLIMFLIFSPHLLWSYENKFSKISSEHFFDLGVSLRSFYLYFAELLPILNEHFHLFIWDSNIDSISFIAPDGKLIFLSALSNELPVIHWPLGVLIFWGFFYCFKQKNKTELIKFSLFMFGFVFTITSFIAGSYSLLDDHWWAGMTLFPGVILFSYMLNDILQKHRFFKFVITGLMIYFLLHSIYFINLPESQFALPKKELYVYYLNKAEIYRLAGEYDWAIDRCYWVLSKTNDKMLVGRANEILSTIQH